MPLKIVLGDITKMQCDVIVNSSNEKLYPNSGVCKAIHDAAGRELLNACSIIKRASVGDCIITNGYNLPCKHVFHIVTPNIRINNSSKILANCYKIAFKYANQLKCNSIAFPLLSSKSGWFPPKKALEIAISSIKSTFKNSNIHVYLVIYDIKTFDYVKDLKKDSTLEYVTTSYDSNNLTEWSDNDILYIHKAQIKCQKDNHNIISATAILTGLNHREISLNVNYCKDCHIFFMNYTTYEMHRKKYGVLLGHLRMESSHNKKDDDYFLADESPLKLCGYSVSQKEGYTSITREYIISQIIDKEIMKKSDVIKYLEYFIYMNGKKKGNEIALSKWESDLKFTLNYHSESQPKYKISRIEKY